ncbi:MAG: hypothetical protein JNIBNLAF_00032 [Nitrosomonas europaea]|nr:hypothetical protein [Nitrosomonas europaea]
MMSWNNKVIWSEGMFLQPQHFQQHDRYFEKLLENRTAPLLGHSWGFSHLEIDPAALMLGKVQLTAARGIFPDGTPFNFPYQDNPPAPLEISTEMQDESVVLALPIRRPGTDETDMENGQNDSLARFSIDEAEVTDSNAQTDSLASLQLGQLRLKLMYKRDMTDAYTTLGVVHVVERRSDNQLIVQKDFIPPMLHASSNPILAGYLQELYGLLHQRGEILASLIAQPGHRGIAEIADFLMLQTINRHEPLFAHLATLPVLHPEHFYSLCLNLAGDLATFSGNRRPQVYPEYQHDALAQSFAPLIADLRRAFTAQIDRNAISIELQERQYGVRIAVIHDKGLFKSAKFVLAANAELSAETMCKRLPSQAKIGPAEKIKDLVNLALPGIPLTPLSVAPRQIPFHAGFNYFELERENDLCKQLEHSGGLAIFIAGDFPGLELELWAIKG